MWQDLSEILREKLQEEIPGCRCEKFLQKPSKTAAVTIAKKLCAPNGKDRTISGLLNKLLAFENRINKGRDHVVHTIHTYLLGAILIDAIDEEKFDKFTWKIASLFHDIGYESADYFKNIPSADNFSADHGLFGALITWGILYEQYSKENPKAQKSCVKMKRSRSGEIYIDYSWDNLNNKILPACEAILFHNKPNVYRNSSLSWNDNKYAFLLIICDTIQVWSRPENGVQISDANVLLRDYLIDISNFGENCCQFSICFPDCVNVTEIKDEINEKCSCDAQLVDLNKLSIKWEC